MRACQPVLGLHSAEFATDEQPVVGRAMVVDGSITVDGVEKPLRERDVLIKWLRMPAEVEVGLGGKMYTPVPQDLGCSLRVEVSIPSQPFTTDLICNSKPVKLPQVQTSSLTHSLTHSLTYSPTHPLTHSPTLSSHSLTHPLTHPLTHSLTPPVAGPVQGRGEAVVV